MIDGIVIAMAFIGLIFIVVLMLFRAFKPDENTVSLILIKDCMQKNEICNIMYGLYFKSFFCGDCVYKYVILLDLLNDTDKKNYLSELSKELHMVKVISAEDLESIFM